MKNRVGLLWLVMTGAVLLLFAAETPAKTLITKYQDQSSSASIQPARMKGQAGIAVVFEGTDDLHYYAAPETAPAPGMELKVSAKADGLTFGNAVYPEYQYYNDPAAGKIEVYVGNFKVFLPITDIGLPVKEVNSSGVILENTTTTVTIKGIACTSELCLAPFTKEVTVDFDPSQQANWAEIRFKAAPPRETDEKPQHGQAELDRATRPQPATTEADAELGELLSGYQESETKEDRINSTAWFLLLAILAGLSINIMPCVLPVIPLIIMRLVKQASESGPRRVALGFSFCGGIVLFFAVFAAISAIIKLSTGATLDLNSIYRNPAAVITLFLFIVFFAWRFWIYSQSPCRHPWPANKATVPDMRARLGWAFLRAS